MISKNHNYLNYFNYFSLIERIPTIQEYQILRKAVNWRLLDKKSTQIGLQGSLYCICAEKNNQIIGMGRIIGDNGLAFYIQDIIVLPEFQRMGIGSAIMKRIMNFVENNVPPSAFLGLFAAKNKEPFYEKFGFIKRPNEDFGHGMFIFWKHNFE